MIYLLLILQLISLCQCSNNGYSYVDRAAMNNSHIQYSSLSSSGIYNGQKLHSNLTKNNYMNSTTVSSHAKDEIKELPPISTLLARKDYINRDDWVEKTSIADKQPDSFDNNYYFSKKPRIEPCYLYSIQLPSADNNMENQQTLHSMVPQPLNINTNRKLQQNPSAQSNSSAAPASKSQKKKIVEKENTELQQFLQSKNIECIIPDVLYKDPINKCIFTKWTALHMLEEKDIPPDYMLCIQCSQLIVRDSKNISTYSIIKARGNKIMLWKAYNEAPLKKSHPSTKGIQDPETYGANDKKRVLKSNLNQILMGYSSYLIRQSKYAQESCFMAYRLSVDCFKHLGPVLENKKVLNCYIDCCGNSAANVMDLMSTNTELLYVDLIFSRQIGSTIGCVCFSNMMIASTDINNANPDHEAINKQEPAIESQPIQQEQHYTTASNTLELNLEALKPIQRVVKSPLKK
ncbi:hypothetical protein NEOKW01_1342 [Nematocida sp. AWRm80]|nr:hypothetical protein NEOKW01_1342 [Nematocida sp. AWRm80]